MGALRMAQLPRIPDLAAQRAAMKDLGFLVGKWAGEARLLRGPGEPVELLQTEKAQYKLDGLILVIEGVGRARSARAVNGRNSRKSRLVRTLGKNSWS